MKTDIHPKYEVCEVSCACGNVFTTRSVKPGIKVEICAACHPFYTGKQKILDTAGRVEKFNRKFSATGGKMVVREPRKQAAKPVLHRNVTSTKTKVLTTTPKAEKAAKEAKKEAKKA
jgi:large subunit ribosomal protein L31